MSRIEQLIAELCPDGVEWKELGEVCQVIRGKRLTKNQLSDNEKYPVFHGGLEPLGFYGKSNRIANTVMVINVGASAGTVGFSFVDFWSSDGCFCIEHSNLLLSRYLYYTLIFQENRLRSKVRAAGIPTLDAIVINKISIPIPPLPIQQEIVRILDTFTNLDAELQAELEARKKQYEHYRNQLLNFEGKEVEWKTLGEVIISLKTGLNPRKNFNLNTPDATNYYVTVRELYSFDIIFTDKTDRVNDEALGLINNRSNLDKGDILFSGTGTIGRTAFVKEKPKNWNIKEGVYVIKPNQSYVMSKFLIYLLKSDNTIRQIENKIVGSPIRSIPMGELKKIVIPIPSLDEQKRIVSLLDSFEELVSSTGSTTGGLPAEIDARRKQYEYYREKLLTFEPLVS